MKPLKFYVNLCMLLHVFIYISYMYERERGRGERGESMESGRLSQGYVVYKRQCPTYAFSPFSR